MAALITEFSDLFSDVPGRTNGTISKQIIRKPHICGTGGSALSREIL